MLLVVVSGPPGCGSYSWASKRYGGVPILEPARYFQENPSAGLGRFARSVVQAAKKNNQCACVVLDEHGDCVLMERLIVAVEDRCMGRRASRQAGSLDGGGREGGTGGGLRKEGFMLRPQSGLRQCVWQLLANWHWSESEARRLLSTWYVEPIKAANLDPKMFDSLTSVEVPDVRSDADAVEEGPKIMFFDPSTPAGTSKAVMEEMKAFDVSVAIFSDETSRDANLDRLGPGQLWSVGTDAFTSLPGGLSRKETAIAVACASLHAQAKRCLFVDGPGSFLPVPNVLIQSSASSPKPIPDTEFERRGSFGTVIGRTSGRPRPPVVPTGSVDAEDATPPPESQSTAVNASRNFSKVTNEKILTHLKGRQNILRNAATGKIIDLHLAGDAASSSALGSTGERYNVHVRVSEEGDVSFSSCTCPYYTGSKDRRGCKHIAALLFVARAAGASQASQLPSQSELGAHPVPATPSVSTTRTDVQERRSSAKETSDTGPPHAVVLEAGSRALPSWLSSAAGKLDAVSKRATKRKRTVAANDASDGDGDGANKHREAPTTGTGKASKRSRTSRRAQVTLDLSSEDEEKRPVRESVAPGGRSTRERGRKGLLDAYSERPDDGADDIEIVDDLDPVEIVDDNGEKVVVAGSTHQPEQEDLIRASTPRRKDCIALDGDEEGDVHKPRLVPLHLAEGSAEAERLTTQETSSLPSTHITRHALSDVVPAVKSLQLISSESRGRDKPAQSLSITDHELTTEMKDPPPGASRQNPTKKSKKSYKDLARQLLG